MQMELNFAYTSLSDSVCSSPGDAKPKHTSSGVSLRPPRIFVLRSRRRINFLAFHLPIRVSLGADFVPKFSRALWIVAIVLSGLETRTGHRV